MLLKFYQCSFQHPQSSAPGLATKVTHILACCPSDFKVILTQSTIYLFMFTFIMLYFKDNTQTTLSVYSWF